MDSIHVIREESSIAESSLFNHRSVYKTPNNNQQPIKPEQLELEVDKAVNPNVLSFNMASKKKLPDTAKKTSSSQKYAVNSELDKILNFPKKPEEMKSSSSKINAGKKSLNFSLRPAANKKNISFAGNDPKKLVLVTNSNLPTDILSTHMSPSLNSTYFNEFQSPTTQKIVISKRDKVFELNRVIGQQHNMTQDYKLLNNFKRSIDGLGNFIHTVRYPYDFKEYFQTHKTVYLLQTPRPDNIQADLFGKKPISQWREELKKKAESYKNRRTTKTK